MRLLLLVACVLLALIPFIQSVEQESLVPSLDWKISNVENCRACQFFCKRFRKSDNSCTSNQCTKVCSEERKSNSMQLDGTLQCTKCKMTCVLQFKLKNDELGTQTCLQHCSSLDECSPSKYHTMESNEFLSMIEELSENETQNKQQTMVRGHTVLHFPSESCLSCRRKCRSSDSSPKCYGECATNACRGADNNIPSLRHL